MKKRLIIAMVQIGAVLILLLITIQVTREHSRGQTEGENSRLDMAAEDMNGQGELPEDTAGSRDSTAAPDDGDGSRDSTAAPDDGDDSEVTVWPDMADGGTSSAPGTSASPAPIYQNVEFEIDSQLGEIQYYWDDNNMRAITELAFLEHNKAMSYSLTGTDDYYYYGEADVAGVPNGQGIAVYADHCYYYGSWKDGKRNGEGTFLHYHIYEVQKNRDEYSYHFYTGGWADDRPEGSGAEHFEFNMHNLEDGLAYNSNLIGTYHSGLYHGDFYITTLSSDNNVKEWDAAAQDGVFQYYSDNRDTKGRRTVMVDRKNDDNYIWMLPADNKNLGVMCLNVSGQRRMEPIK